jgi:hypothetical protein
MIGKIVFGEARGCVGGPEKPGIYLSSFTEGAGGKIKIIYIAIIVFTPSS